MWHVSEATSVYYSNILNLELRSKIIYLGEKVGALYGDKVTFLKNGIFKKKYMG